MSCTTIFGSSTDVGDISWVCPTTGMRAATWVPGTVAHSWQAVVAGGTSIGHKGMMVAAKTALIGFMWSPNKNRNQALRTRRPPAPAWHRLL